MCVCVSVCTLARDIACVQTSMPTKRRVFPFVFHYYIVLHRVVKIEIPVWVAFIQRMKEQREWGNREEQR